MRNHIKKFHSFLLENMQEPDHRLSITLEDFERMLRTKHKSWLSRVEDEDDRLGFWDYYSEIARDLEMEYGIRADWDTGEFEYTQRNSNWMDPYDEDEEDYEDW